MLSKKIQAALEGSSAIRAMFVEGKELAAKVGAENVFDFSLGNPATPAPESVKQAIKDLLDEQKPLFENVKVNEKSMKPVKKYMYWLILFGVLDLAGVVALVLMELGVF